MNPPDNSPSPHSDVTLEHLARRQLADYDHGEPGTAFADGLRLSLAEAYRVQSLVAELRERRGERVIGYKLGCTSPVIRQLMGIGHPVFGRLFDSDRWPSGTSLPATRFAGLAIEGELAVRLAGDLSAGAASGAEFSAARHTGHRECLNPYLHHGRLERGADCHRDSRGRCRGRGRAHRHHHP